MWSARWWGLAVAGVGVWWWSVGLTVLQPLTEPFGPWPEALASTNTYWARDLRFMTVVAIVVGLALAARGERIRVGRAVVVGALWILADLVLDRADVTGVAATVLLALGGGAVALGTAAPWRRVGVPVDRRVLIVAASVAAALVPLAVGIGSPTGREPELTPSALVTGALLLGATVGCAVVAAPRADRACTAWRAGALCGVGAAGAVLVRLLPAGGWRFVAVAVLGALLLVGVALITARRSELVAGGRPDGRGGWLRTVAPGLAVLIGYPVMVAVVLVLTGTVLPVAPGLTRAAGNIAVSATDLDLLYALGGLVPGLLIGLLLARQATTHPRQRSEPAPPIPPVE